MTLCVLRGPSCGKTTARPVFVWVITALITLHQPDGKPVYVNPEEIQIVAPAGGVYPGKAKVLVHDQWLAVLETPEQVKFARDGECWPGRKNTTIRRCWI